jgi:HSP20 family protein
MRYRRASYRFAFAVTAGGLPPFGAYDLLEPPRVRLAQRHWRPAADVYETADAITVAIELAGVDPDEVDIELFENALTVAGQRRLTSVEPGVYRAAEIRQGPFRLELELPAPVDLDMVDAHAERGLLVMTLAKAREQGNRG